MNDYPLSQEQDYVDAKKSVVVAITAVAVFIAAIAVAALLLAWTAKQLGGMPQREPPTQFAPREIGGVEQTPIETDRFGLRLFDEQRQQLNSYGWVDTKAQQVHIPIQTAIEIFARTANEPATPAPQSPSPPTKR